MSPPSTPLSRIREIALRRGHAAIAREAEALVRRQEEGRFFLAVVGQFKRGKTTLVNALLGEAVLPTGLLPVTSVITIVRHGDVPRATVERREGGEEVVPLESIAAYATEEGNPGNRRNVAAVLVDHPSPLLRSGVCLVDTPGVGSVFDLSSEATHAFVPRLDAALVVLGADPPISAAELDLLERISREVRDFIFVLNKVDLVAERDREIVSAFCARVIAERLGLGTPEILPVSVKGGVAGRGEGVGALAGRIARLAERAGARLAAEAAERGARRLCAELISACRLERRVLTEPAARFSSAIETFRRESRQIARLLDDLGYLLQAETDKVSRWLEDEARALLETSPARLAAKARAHVQSLRDVPARRLRRAAVPFVRDLVRTTLDDWLKSMEPAVEEAYRRLTSRFLEASNACAARISAAASRDLGLAVEPVPPEPGLRAASRLYYLLEGGEVFLDVGGALTALLDGALGRGRAVRRASEWLASCAGDWVHANVTRIVDDLKERLEESRRRFEFELRERLESALRIVKEAQRRADRLKAGGEAAVEAEVRALDEALSAIEAIREDIERGRGGAPEPVENPIPSRPRNLTDPETDPRIRSARRR